MQENLSKDKISIF